MSCPRPPKGPRVWGLNSWVATKSRFRGGFCFPGGFQPICFEHDELGDPWISIGYPHWCSRELGGVLSKTDGCASFPSLSSFSGSSSFDGLERCSLFAWIALILAGNDFGSDLDVAMWCAMVWQITNQLSEHNSYDCVSHSFYNNDCSNLHNFCCFEVEGAGLDPLGVQQLKGVSVSADSGNLFAGRNDKALAAQGIAKTCIPPSLPLGFPVPGKPEGRRASDIALDATCNNQRELVDTMSSAAYDLATAIECDIRLPLAREKSAVVSNNFKTACLLRSAL